MPKKLLINSYLTISNNVKVIHTFDFEFKASVLNKIINLYIFFNSYYPQTFVQGGGLGLVTFKWKRVQLKQKLLLNEIMYILMYLIYSGFKTASEHWALHSQLTAV